MRFTYRKKGLPRRVKRLVTQGFCFSCDIYVDEPDAPMAKVIVFKNRKSMRHFYANVIPKYRGPDPLDVGCQGCVNKLIVAQVDPHTSEVVSVQVDRRYFCIVLLVEGFLSNEVILHEAVHVGFAWDYRTQGVSRYSVADMSEENVCYPAGLFADALLKIIEEEGLRRT